MTRSRIVLFFFFMIGVSFSGKAQTPRSEVLFDNGWKFQIGNLAKAAEPTFDDKTWRSLDLPHDWSIEELPNQEKGKVVGPFSKESVGTTATGYTVGGTAWYRKTFSLKSTEPFTKTIISFDGVYMNSEVWVNGKFVGVHPYGYTAFQYDITDFLLPAGKPNVIAVKVQNEGKNSRWYSGSGIYRHVWLIQKQSTHIAHNGLFVHAENLSDKVADLKISTNIVNSDSEKSNVKLQIKVIDPHGKIVQQSETGIGQLTPGNKEITQHIRVSQPQAWSTETPNLYKTEAIVLVNGKITDKATVSFGIRTIHFSAQSGFLLNGKKVLLKGGCMHHDNGFLGSATIDRAEERRVELMKQNGFNAIRTSHNLPSTQFLNACDRLGVLVIDEAFDMWERPKNTEDYHLYFSTWWKRDLESMIYRDRNHPSVILWSIGNELNERADSLGFAIRKRLVAEVHKLDATRPVTEAICSFWDHQGQKWSTTEPSYADLDVGGYNYLDKQYEPDHKEFPERIMVGTESYPGEAYAYWQQVEKNAWVIGDFVWTAMDYLGETACGNSSIGTRKTMQVGLKPWPWFNAFCGDIDLCGFKKPQSYYRDVVWNRSSIEMMVHTPIPEGMVETVSYWGWPDELPSWNWNVDEGKLMDVRVFSKSPVVRLELNGHLIAEQSINTQTGITANFKVPYKAGILKAVALENGKVVATKVLKTTGMPAKIRLTADRKKITANRNDLSYVKIEITDNEGNLIPNANIPARLTVAGEGEIAGSGNACPTDMESFNAPVCRTYNGQALAILRPLANNKKGVITLKAEAEGLGTGTITIEVK